MVKLTQAIRQQKPTNCLSMFYQFVRLALKGLKKYLCGILMKLIRKSQLDSINEACFNVLVFWKDEIV